MPENTILKLEQVNKTYLGSSRELQVLTDINLSISCSSTVAIVGPSGSGKTTLLGICAGLDNPSSGNIFLNNIALHTLNEDRRAQVRNEWVGFIFQNFQLIPTLTALENIMVPMELRRNKQAKTAAMELLHKVGLTDRAHHYPSQLSGGEQQRVSLARAFINKPAVLFADEPTGSLDADTSDIIIQLMFDLNAQAGTTLILVTHDADLAARTQRIIKIKGGRIISDLPTAMQ